MMSMELKERRIELTAALNEIVGMQRLGWYPGLLGSSRSQIEDEIDDLDAQIAALEG